MSYYEPNHSLTDDFYRWLRDVLSKAWEEGREAGRGETSPGAVSNPYRSAKFPPEV